MQDHTQSPITTEETPERATIRPETRAAWHALIDAGEEPSVRKVYERIGGTYGRVVEECRLLRAEETGFAASPETSEQPAPEKAPDEPSAETPEDVPPAAECAPVVTGTPPVRAETEQALRAAQEALRSAQQKRQRLTAKITEARQAYEAAQETVRMLQQRLLAEEPLGDALENAYKSRDAARFVLEDWEAQVDQIEAEIVQAERAIGDADVALRLCHYNDLAAQRAELRSSLEASLAQMETDLEAFIAHDEKQREAAKALGFDRLPGDLDAQHGRESANGQGILNAFVSGRLSRFLKPPASNINPAHRVRVEELADADVASIPLSGEQARELTAPDRHRRASLPPDLHGPGYRNLMAVGIPALLFGHSYPLPVTAEQLTRIRRAGIPVHTA